MDYRGYENKTNEIKKKITDFILLKNEKTQEYAEGTINAYLDLLNKSDISVKSFKLKIVHNEQTCKKNLSELEEEFPNILNDISQFFEGFFQDYEKNLPNYKFFQNRKTDLLLINSHLKRKRQDALVRINNYEKDLVSKEKEKNLLITEKTKAHNQFIFETNRRLNIDLQRTIDNCTKEYLPLERELLDVDEKNKILELKEKIKNSRSKSLEKQAELKNKAYIVIKDEEIRFVNEIQKIETEYEDSKKEYECKILESKKSIQLYQLEESRNTFEFDYSKDSEAIEKYKDYIKKYLDIVREYNKAIINDENYEKTIDTSIQSKIFKNTLEFYSYGFYNPIIIVLNGIKNLYDEINNYYSLKTIEYKKIKDEKYLQIFEKLEKFDEAIFKTKKTSLENYVNVIDTGLNNLYANDYLNKQKEILTKFLENVLDIIINLSKKFVSELDEKEYNLDNILVDRQKMIEDFDNYDEKLCLINDNIKLIESKSNEFCETYMKKRDKEKTDFYAEDKEKMSSIENNYLLKVNKIEKDVKKINEDKNLLLQKKIKDLTNEFNKNCLEVNATLKYYKKIL